MKKALLTAVFISLILFCFVTTSSSYIVMADSDGSIIYDPDSGITIYSPVNMTYYYKYLLLNLSLYTAGNFSSVDSHISMNYSIDRVYNGSVPLKSNGEFHLFTRALGVCSLPELTEGSHYLTIYLYGLNQRSLEPKYLSYINTVYFNTTYDPSAAPTMTPTPIAAPTSTPTSTIAPTQSSSSTSPTPTSSPTPPSSTPTPLFPKPSIPEFTVKLLSSQIENKSSIQFTIKNQPFDRSLNYSFLYYNLRYRVNASNWSEVYKPDDGYPAQSNSDFTVLSFSSSSEYEGYFLDISTNPPWSFAIIAPANSVLDVQAEALIGYIHRVFNPNATDQLSMYPYVFTGETSGWSNAQTITIPETAPSPSVTPSPSIPEFPTMILPILMAAIVVGTIAYRRKPNNKSSISKGA
jgi:hypothetical protein